MYQISNNERGATVLEQRIIKLNSINFCKNEQQNIIPLITKNNCLIIYCLKGNSSIRIKNAVYELEENCYFIIPPNSSIIKKETGKSVILDVEYSDYIQPLLMNKFLDKDKNIVYLIKKIYKTRYEDLKYKNEITVSCQTLIMLEIMNNSSFFYLNKQADINDVIDFLKANYNQTLNFEEISKSFGYSYSNLRRIFKETTGYSMKKYLTELKLIEATRLLTDTNLSISSIAERVNFSRAKYFTQIFQSKHGLTPKEYRLKKE